VTRPVLRDALALTTRACEALDDGDVQLATRTLENLARNLEDALRPRARRPRCPHCGLRFRWPGELDHHLRFSACWQSNRGRSAA
jgi:hypothetical protein